MKRIYSLVLSLALALSWFGLSSVPLVHAASFIVNSTSDAVDDNIGDGICHTAAGECTLRAAVQEANALNGDDTITLPASAINLTLSGTGEDLSALGDLDITSNMTINGSSATTTFVNGSALGDRIFHILSGNVTISNVTIQGGSADSDNGGGILVAGGSLALANSRVSGNSAVSGGGIALVGGSLNVNFSTVGADAGPSNTASANGGGIFVGSGRTAIVRNSTISFNTAKGGGGVYVSSGGTLNLNSSTISTNTANTTDVTDGGGGLFAAGTANINSSTVANNTLNGVNGAGGGVLQLGGTINLRNTIVADNQGPASSPRLFGDAGFQRLQLIGKRSGV